MKRVAWATIAVTLCIAGQCARAGSSTTAPATTPTTLPNLADTSGNREGATAPSIKEKLIDSLPPAIGDGLEIDTWGWLSDLQQTRGDSDNYYDLELSLGITKSFGQRFAVSAQGNFIDASGTRRGELEQGYVSLALNEKQGSFLTVGKFNATFGVEERDFWNRTTGTTSLLFGAQPQDLVGVMLTQPIGETGVNVRPFLTEDFQGQFYFNQSPYAGINVVYQPIHDLTFGVTGMVGPGFVLMGGRPIHSPYPTGAYGDDNPMTANWQGPRLDANLGGTLFFVDAKAIWQVRPDLRLSTEFLQENTTTSTGSWGWFGFLAQVDYDLTDRLHCFARWSYLDDSDWIVTGAFQRVQEISGGAGYRLFDGIELRGEYRHDVSSVSGSLESVSVHLSFAY